MREVDLRLEADNAEVFAANFEDVCRRWQHTASFADFSIGRLILESVSRGVVRRMYFPVEMVLMVKAIVIFEGVGNYLNPASTSPPSPARTSTGCSCRGSAR